MVPPWKSTKGFLESWPLVAAASVVIIISCCISWRAANADYAKKPHRHAGLHGTRVTKDKKFIGFKDSGGAKLELEDVIVGEQLTRNVQFLGPKVVSGLLGSRIVVIGLGGVGSHAAHMLLRSGVGQLKVVDFDQVTLSSLNRHAVATRADVGKPKATVLASHFDQIFPEAHVEAMVCMFNAKSEEAVLGGPRPDFVLDAIDNKATKVALLAACCRRGLPVLSVGGAGAKKDPTRLRFVDLLEATPDPLMRSVRYNLRRHHGIHTGVDVLLSTERPACGLVTTEEQAAAPSMLDYQTIPNFRVRAIPVLGTAPALFGVAAASWILCKITDQLAALERSKGSLTGANACTAHVKVPPTGGTEGGLAEGAAAMRMAPPFFSEPAFYLRRPQYEALLESLYEHVAAEAGNIDDVAVDLEEVTFVVGAVWRGLSAFEMGVSSRSNDKAWHRRTPGLCLARYRRGQACTPDNIVLLRNEEAEELRALGLEAWRTKHPIVATYVDDVLQRVRAIFGDIE